MNDLIIDAMKRAFGDLELPFLISRQLKMRDRNPDQYEDAQKVAGDVPRQDAQFRARLSEQTGLSADAFPADWILRLLDLQNAGHDYSGTDVKKRLEPDQLIEIGVMKAAAAAKPDVLERIYLKLLGRPSDPEGRLFWEAQIERWLKPFFQQTDAAQHSPTNGGTDART